MIDPSTNYREIAMQRNKCCEIATAKRRQREKDNSEANECYIGKY